jgi:predicted nucleic acid-binding protein
LSAYADASFLGSLYIADANSASASAKITKARLPLFVSSLSEVELMNAISLWVFRQKVTRLQAKSAYQLFEKDVAEGILLVRSVPASAYERARHIAQTQTPLLGTRTLDLLHVACAQSLQATVFYTFDSRRGKLAKSEGLRLA